MRTKSLMMSAACVLALAGCGSSHEDDDDDTNTGTGGTAANPPMDQNPNPGTGSGGTSPAPTGSGGMASTSGSGGAPVVPVAGNGGGTGGMGSVVDPNEDTDFPDPRGGCPGIDSGFPGDNTCIAPPDPSEGFQIHIGPKNYDDPAEINKFRFTPGSESSQCWTFHTPNDQEVFYDSFVVSGRPGTHHIINTMYKTDKADGGFVLCSDGGTGSNSDIIANLPGASKAYMARRKIAPENVNLGRPVPAKAASQADMHYFNYTREDILREFWMNVYYMPKDQVKQIPTQIRAMGGFSWSFAPIPAGWSEVYKYEAPITADGRILSLLGHYHSHGKRFTAHIRRASGERLKVFEMYNYLDPLVFQYDSISKNPEFSTMAGGAFTGTLEVKSGDVLEWECDINNDSNVGLTYTNNVTTGEMCNLWGESLGPVINVVLP